MASADKVVPILGGAAITPSNTVNLPIAARAIYVGGSGDVKVTTIDGSVLTFSSIPSGSLLPVSCLRVWADSTATSMLALF